MFLLPLKLNRKYSSFPYITVVLIVICTIIFWSTVWDLGNIISSFGFTITGHWWYTWFTSLFLHGSLSHWLFNMYYLWLFGSFLEDALGRTKFCLIYFTGGAFSCFSQAIITKIFLPQAVDLPAIGASGAIAAVMGVFALRFLYYKIKFGYFIVLFAFIRWGTFEISSIAALLLWLAEELFFGLFQLTGSSGGGGVAYWAHIGGFIFGLIWAKTQKFEDSGKLDYYLEEARRLARRDHVLPALTNYDAALKINPGDAGIMAEMAPLLASSDQEGKAVLFYQTAINRLLEEDQRERVVGLLISIREKIGDLSRISLKEKDKYNLACVAETKNYLGLAEEFLKGLSTSNDLRLQEMSVFRLARVLRRQKRLEEAKETYQEFLVKFPQSEWSNLARKELELLERLSGLDVEGPFPSPL